MVATRRTDYLTLKAYKVWEEWVFLAHSDQNRAYLFSFLIAIFFLS